VTIVDALQKVDVREGAEELRSKKVSTEKFLKDGVLQHDHYLALCFLR
jgi:hypothetical protein